MNQFTAVVRTVPYRSRPGGVPIRLTELELLYADGRDCGVPLYVSGFEEVTRLLRLAGVTAEELNLSRADYDRGEAVRITFSTDEDVIKAMGFDPRRKGNQFRPASRLRE